MRPLPILRTRGQFLTVHRQGKRIGGKLLVLWVLRQPTPTGQRLGLTVSRRVGNAVCRNRVRRRLKELLRCHPQWMRAAYDHIVVAQPAAAWASTDQLEAELAELVGRWKRREPSLSTA
jgi:ribonuclease P protein component